VIAVRRFSGKMFLWYELNERIFQDASRKWLI